MATSHLPSQCGEEEKMMEWVCEFGCGQTLILMVIGIIALTFMGARRWNWDGETAILGAFVVMWVLAICIVLLGVDYCSWG